MYFLYDFYIDIKIILCIICTIFTKMENKMKLRTCRIGKKLSQDEAAAELNVTKDVYTSWEYGNRIPRTENMENIFKWSGGQVTPNDFYNVANDNEIPDIVA